MKNRLKEIRQEKKLSKKDLAKKLNISQQAISLYEKGDREPKLETWQKLADFFHVPTEYLMGLTNDRVTLTINDLNPAEEDAYKHITAMLSEDYPKGSISKNKIGRLLADEGLWEE
ncbi:helix-turn-helix transcriptional regulator [Lactobacillus johnsonii]|uniref:helix-turn-helix transcriptional regulator n=1 Tax=Lactobacillus johnsonii TaxID=33959 RepID=UPI001CBB71FB|nr:helix-turn-helix transcriptional regulator [Lactobacillus johnsonii]MBZ4026379.1 helix-turn-helix transcriptional regulator [Lactobacillus johnsonii]